MTRLKRNADGILFAAFVLLILFVGLAMNKHEVRSLTPEDSLLPVDPSFTYQGFLEDGGVPVNGNCDFSFILYDKATGGSTIGNPDTAVLAVDRGVFSTRLDFGNVPYSSERMWVSVGVRCPAGSGSYTTLSPRTEIVAAPLANNMPNVSISPSDGDVRIKSLDVYNDARIDGKLEIMGPVVPHVRLDGSGNSGSVYIYSGSTNVAGMYTIGDSGKVNVRQGFFDEERAYMYVNGADDYGYFETEGPSGGNNVTLGITSDPNHGLVVVQNSSGSGRAYMYVDGNNEGWISVFDSFGDERAYLNVDSAGAGYFETEGPNGANNFTLSSLSGYGNNGYAAVQDSGGSNQAGMYVNSSGLGVLFSDISSIRVADPTDDQAEIWYSSLEGPEAAAYVRGTAQLVDGQATITFPDHFLAVASEQGMTIQLTPLSADSLGLAVVKKGLDGVVVQELHNGTGTYEFDFMVTAVRLGYENYKVVRSATELKTTDAGTETESDIVLGGSDE